MSTTAESPPSAGPASAVRPSGRGRRRGSVIGLVVVLAVAGVALAVTKPFATGGPSRPGVVDNADPTGLQTVTRQDLSEQTQVSATLGYAGSYSVVNQAQGTVTSLPAVGQVVSQGQVLYQVSGAPVVLLYGTTPAYRALSEDMTGSDVAELNADLVALGYVTSCGDPLGHRRLHLLDQSGRGEAPRRLGRHRERHPCPGPGGVRTHRGSGHDHLGHSGCSGPAGTAGAHRHLDHPPGQHRPGRRPTVRGGRR